MTEMTGDRLLQQGGRIRLGTAGHRFGEPKPLAPALARLGRPRGQARRAGGALRFILRASVFGTLLAGVVGAPSNALACGAIGDDVRLLLPAEEATTVPTNAALWASTFLYPVEFELETVDGNTPVSVTVTCERAEGHLCQGIPVALDANTTYRYRARTIPPEESGPTEGAATEWSTFTTGSSTDTAAPPATAGSVEVLSVSDVAGNDCGFQTSVGLAVDLSELTEPALLVAEDVLPGIAQHVNVYPGGAQEIHVNDPPECFQPVLIDGAGHEVELDEVCLPQGPKPTAPETGSGGGAGQEAGEAAAAGDDAPGASGDGGGCQVSAHGAGAGSAPGALVGLGLTALFALRRRRAAVVVARPGA